MGTQSWGRKDLSAHKVTISHGPRKHFFPFSGSLCSFVTHTWILIHSPFSIHRAHLPSLTACSREIKVWSACLHTLVSSRVTGTHLLQLLAWWGKVEVSGSRADLWVGDAVQEGEWYLEAELWGLEALGYRWQLQEVPTDDQLDPSKWLILLPDSSGEEQAMLYWRG